jgi:replicative superfamily II helicase
VSLAASLRERDGLPPVGYYHGGLPARVRRVIEQLFLDGQITALVATGAFPEAFAPGDVSRVVLAGLPQSRAQLLEAAAVAGLSGKAATIVLAYSRRDLTPNRESLQERYPSRDRLVELYRTLRSPADPSSRDGVLWPGEALDPALTAAGWSPAATEAALEILAQAGVIQRELLEGRWRIELAGGPGRDLATSLRYQEGQRERDAQDAVLELAFGPASAILRVLAGPTQVS